MTRRMTRRNPKSGLTLIEVLIAVSLLSLITVGMMWAIRIAFNSMGKADERLLTNRRVTGAQRVLEQEIYDLIPASAEILRGGQVTNGQVVPFFQGEGQSMRFVSSYSLKEGSRGHAQILAFQVVPGENGGVRLIVNETPYTGSRSTGAFVTGRSLSGATGRPMLQFVPIEPGGNSFVIADKLAACSFSYQELRPRPEFERWTNAWALEEWPGAIRIRMEPLPEVGNRLHMIDIVAPVRVNRSQLEPYEDNS